MATLEELRAAKAQRQTSGGDKLQELRALAAARQGGVLDREIAAADQRLAPTGAGFGATAADMAKSLGAGLARGGAELVGLPGTLQDLAMAGAGKAGLLNEDAMQYGAQSDLSGSNLRGLLSGATGGATEYEPTTTAGEYMGTVGEFLPGAAVGGGGAKALLQYGVIPALASESAGQLTEGTAAEPYARTGAALLSPASAQGAQRAARAVVSPSGGADASRIAAAKALEARGIRPTAGQATGSEPQMYREAATAAGRALASEGADDFTQAALRSIGSDARRATPDVMEEAATRIGGVFNDVARRVDVTPTNQTVARVADVLDEYRQLAPAAEAPPLFRNIGDAIAAAAQSRAVIPGRSVQSWRTQLGKLKSSANPATREAARSMTDALDEVMEISAATAGMSDDVARLTSARKEYRNLLAIEDAVSRAGVDKAGGVITPQALRSAVLRQGRRGYVQGKGDLAQLAREGTQVMEQLPNSGTAPRLTAGQVIPGASGGTATGLGAAALGADPVTATGLGLLAAIAPSARNRALATGAGQSYMRNQALGPATPQKIADYLKTVPGLLAQ